MGCTISTEKHIQIHSHGDLISVKNNVAILWDCKTLANKNGLFPLDRVEENQRLASQRFLECGNNWYNLAIIWNNNVYVEPIYAIDFNEKSLDLKDNIPFVNNFYEKLEKLRGEN